MKGRVAGKAASARRYHEKSPPEQDAIKDVMKRLKDETRALEVVENGAVVGQVSRRTVIARLIGPQD